MDRLLKQADFTAKIQSTKLHISGEQSVQPPIVAVLCLGVRRFSAEPVPSDDSFRAFVLRNCTRCCTPIAKTYFSLISLLAATVALYAGSVFLSLIAGNHKADSNAMSSGVLAVLIARDTLYNLYPRDACGDWSKMMRLKTGRRRRQKGLGVAKGSQKVLRTFRADGPD